MAVEKNNVASFLKLANECPVLDVRSPGEYNHAHIPGAYSLPLFTDEERKIVGTAYKQQSREAAIKIGLDFFGAKMRRMVEEVESLVASHASINSGNKIDDSQDAKKKVLVHCWRGGMRSAGVAWLLDLYGFKVHTLTGGYKFYRRWVLETIAQPYQFKILGGFTGTGKTEILKEIGRKSIPTVDLEQLAHHKGSAFGGLGEDAQPNQEFFENKLAKELSRVTGILETGKEEADHTLNGQTIWLEDESQRIGTVNIPQSFWLNMRNSPVYFVDVPFEKRLSRIVEGYGGFNKEDLSGSILRINKRLGGLETKTALQYLEDGNTRECFRILLRYYDKLYWKSLHNRTSLSDLLIKIESNTTEAELNARLLLQEHSLTSIK